MRPKVVSRTLLIGDPARSWREWVRNRGAGRDLLVLDPNEPGISYPGRFELIRDGKVVWSRFYGGLDPLKAPHLLIAALVAGLRHAVEDVDVCLFNFRPTPVLRQTTALAAQIVRPERILVPEGLEINLNGFPVGPERIEIPAAFPAMVEQAQRKARWIKLLEACESHVVEMKSISFEGCRLGTGTAVGLNLLRDCGLGETSYAERAGANLLVVTHESPSEATVAKLLDRSGAQKATIVDPARYSGVHCAFADDEGEDFGYGFIQDTDLATGLIRCLCTAVPPAPVRILKLGWLRVDRSGSELGELKPWDV